MCQNYGCHLVMVKIQWFPFFRLYIYRHPIFPLDIQDKMLQSVIGHLKSGTLASVTGKFLAWWEFFQILVIVAFKAQVESTFFVKEFALHSKCKMGSVKPQAVNSFKHEQLTASYSAYSLLLSSIEDIEIKWCVPQVNKEHAANRKYKTNNRLFSDGINRQFIVHCSLWTD